MCDCQSNSQGSSSIPVRTRPAHLDMPADGVSFDNNAYVTLPAIGASVVVIDFLVPEGMHGVIRKIGNVYVGTGFVEGSGDLKWQIIVNGAVVRNYENILASLGSVVQPSEIAGILIKEQQEVQFVLTNMNLAVGNATVGARMSGWHYPKYHEPDDIWL